MRSIFLTRSFGRILLRPPRRYQMPSGDSQASSTDKYEPSASFSLTCVWAKAELAQSTTIRIPKDNRIMVFRLQLQRIGKRALDLRFGRLHRRESMRRAEVIAPGDVDDLRR